MNKTLTTVCMALLGSTFLAPGAKAPTAPDLAPPIPGPGSVAIAVQEFVTRLDKGEGLEALLVDETHDIEFTYADGLQIVEDEKRVVAAFFDVGHDGRPFASAGAKGFAKASRGAIACNEKAQREVHTELSRVRANCASQRCSTAVVEFTRVYTIGGGKQMHVPMRATALLRYVDVTDVQGINFKVFHWHASPVRL